ncbi:MAG TPA: PhnD/SsuA/transferrin family substrate-binding protein [Spirochaetota bacterium]|nr:PhnD/SsuA/transferrin family substrate-binding protein [Spirochaetota bacterium]HPG49057.1 PhnD/SsuA/transferrin family substrate-binding protein [Spirochaetota bacterium]HPN11872.1 PhnD/SsuA/transferrin family substrate-binding protein [Spirochaetota bacterium]
MKIRRIIAVTLIVLFGYICIPVQNDANSAEKISFTVIFLGGPDTGAEGEKIINQFISSLAKISGMKKDAFQGKYFNTIAEAKAYIQQNKNSYIMGSIGFFLAQRTFMNLVPLAVVKQQGSATEQYKLIIKKGAFKSLKQLKGKILAGNVLYEDKKFINKMIFDGKIDISSHFQLKPTSRPLSALRKLTSGEYAAVLINTRDYNSLKTLDLFPKIEILYSSPTMPALGLMMVNTKTNQAAQSKIINAVTRMCGQADTREVCKSFSIGGFEKIEAEILKDEITKYESGK